MTGYIVDFGQNQELTQQSHINATFLFEEAIIEKYMSCLNIQYFVK